jgi:hypothetical protein
MIIIEESSLQLYASALVIKIQDFLKILLCFSCNYEVEILEAQFSVSGRMLEKFSFWFHSLAFGQNVPLSQLEQI